MAFSHLYTGLDYDGIGGYVGSRTIVDDSTEPVPTEKLQQLGELCRWLYGSKKDKQKPIIASQNPDLRQLDDVLKSREGTVALRAGETLTVAFQASQPANIVFEEAVFAAKRSLTTARAHLTTGYVEKSLEILRLAGTVASMTDDIYSEMERKYNEEKGRKKKRMTEDE